MEKFNQYFMVRNSGMTFALQGISLSESIKSSGSIESCLIYAFSEFLVKIRIRLLLAERFLELPPSPSENSWFSSWWDKEENES